MSCEVCPFCGKTYKRLKSHLPHCKAAAASKAPPSKPDVTANQTASSSQLDSVLSRATAKGRKSSSVITDLQGQTRKRDTASGPSNATSSSPRTSSSMTLLSPTTKTKQKLVDQIKTSTLLLSPSPALPPTTSKPKKKSLRALIEAAKYDQITKESLKVSETEPTLSSRNTAQTEPKTISGKDYAHLSADAKPKDAAKKTPKTTKSAPVGQFSSLLSPLVSQSLPVKVETVEKPEVRKQSTAENPNEGALTHRSLGQVRLRELPKWLACKAPSHPKDAVGMLQRGWQWYYRRYIDVRKGGVGGLGMLLAGYCVLSYIWSYRHIKLDRWRKYH
ncbi:uncharacterized protein C17orf80 homolog [Neolamprologus brichardi]|uniref:uncharacterized protein C17orf80 homolog n=1 Tax=Neolamprologus brichardi TaxID=32507 RepID=UPI0003EBD260|nr:uncharacterized protein C17orf80 homolog [Neolamprologus brichardi]